MGECDLHGDTTLRCTDIEEGGYRDQGNLSARACCRYDAATRHALQEKSQCARIGIECVESSCAECAALRIAGNQGLLQPAPVTVHTRIDAVELPADIMRACLIEVGGHSAVLK